MIALKMQDRRAARQSGVGVHGANNPAAHHHHTASRQSEFVEPIHATNLGETTFTTVTRARRIAKLCASSHRDLSTYTRRAAKNSRNNKRESSAKMSYVTIDSWSNRGSESTL